MLVEVSPTNNSRQNDVCDQNSIRHDSHDYQAGCQVSERSRFPPNLHLRMNYRSISKTCTQREIASLSTAVGSRLFAASCNWTLQLSVSDRNPAAPTPRRMIT